MVNVRVTVVFQRHYQSFKFSHKARCMDNYEESRLTKYTFGNLMSQGILLDGYKGHKFSNLLKILYDFKTAV